MGDKSQEEVPLKDLATLLQSKLPRL